MKVNSALLFWAWFAGTIVGILAAEDSGLVKKLIIGSWPVFGVAHWIISRVKGGKKHG